MLTPREVAVEGPKLKCNTVEYPCLIRLRAILKVKVEETEARCLPQCEAERLPHFKRRFLVVFVFFLRAIVVFLAMYRERYNEHSESRIVCENFAHLNNSLMAGELEGVVEGSLSGDLELL